MSGADLVCRSFHQSGPVLAAKLILEWRSRGQSYRGHVVNSLTLGKSFSPHLRTDSSKPWDIQSIPSGPRPVRGEDSARKMSTPEPVPLSKQVCKPDHRRSSANSCLVRGPRRRVAIIRCVYLNTKVRELSSWYSSHIEVVCTVSLLIKVLTNLVALPKYTLLRNSSKQQSNL